MLWEFLHGVASLCTPADAARFTALIDTLHTLLPCDKCLKDYPLALHAVVSERGLPARACEEGQAQAFVHDLHAAVNTKLARQRYEALLADASLPPEPTQEALHILFPGLSTPSLLRKAALLQPNPFHVESLSVLLLILVCRLQSAREHADFLVFLDTAAVMLDRVRDSQDAERAAGRWGCAYRVLLAKVAERTQSADEVSEQAQWGEDMSACFYRVMRCAYAGRALSEAEDAALVARVAMAQSGWTPATSSDCLATEGGCP